MPLPRGRRGLPRLGALALAVALLLGMLQVLPPAGAATTPAASSASGGGTPPGAQADAPTQAGSFQPAPVRILGIPVLIVASPALGSASGGSPDAAARARMIEGNLALLYRPRSLCSGGEWLAEMFVEVGFLHGHESACSDDLLGLRGPPEAFRIEAGQQGDGPIVLLARLPGRERPLPLLTVTDADARLNGTTTERLAQRWSALLQRRLRYARHLLTPAQLWVRWRRVAVMELALGTLLVGVLFLWRLFRRRTAVPAAAPERPPGVRRTLQLPLAGVLSRLLLATALAVLVTMAGVGAFAVPGEVPLALDLLLQPLGVVLKLAVVGVAAVLVRMLGRLLLSQWSSRADLPEERRARRDQRHRSLQLMSRRLTDLGAVVLVSLWVVAGIPGVREVSANAVLASGALLGALAIVFQGLLRDFAAGLVVLFDDRYAIGDSVDLAGFSGEVVDLGVLSTELRGPDQRVVTVPNSRCEPVVNHTKLRSGAELKLPLAPGGLDLPRALAVVREEAAAFAVDPAWQPHLLQPPQVRGVSEVTAEGVWLSVLLATAAGRQGAARRALLGRLVERLGREGIALASSSG